LFLAATNLLVNISSVCDFSRLLFKLQSNPDQEQFSPF